MGHLLRLPLVFLLTANEVLLTNQFDLSSQWNAKNEEIQARFQYSSNHDNFGYTNQLICPRLPER